VVTSSAPAEKSKSAGSPSVLAARRLKATQDIIDALDRAIMDETRLHPPPVQQPEIGTA
jgi:hypothetical protein